MGKKITEIRWHARGGQGAVTAAKMLAEMALSKGLYFQAFPEYGPERMGAPIQCFNRLSEEPIRTYYSVTEPDIVVVVDPSLCDVINFSAGMPKGAQVIVNTGECPDTVKSKYRLDDYSVATVDAVKISMETMGRSMPNVPMLGALLQINKLFTLEEAKAFTQNYFADKFSAKVINANLAALERAFQEVQING